MPTRFILGQNPINREDKEIKKQSTMKRPNCFHVLRTSTPKLYTSTPNANLDAVGETGQPDLGRFQGVPSAPSWFVCGGNLPIG